MMSRNRIHRLRSFTRSAGLSLALTGLMLFSMLGTALTPGLAAVVRAQDESGVATLTGTVTINNPDFVSTFSQHYMMLMDLMSLMGAGALDETAPAATPDPNASPTPAPSIALTGQVLGQINGDLSKGAPFRIDLPISPRGTGYSFASGKADAKGVQVYSVEFMANQEGDPFISSPEIGTFGYSSLQFSVGDYNIIGGRLVVWAPDDKQVFPTGMGRDGILFTADDPVGPIAAGWSVVDLGADPFTVERQPTVNIPIIEGDDGFTNYSDMSYTKAFDALIKDLKAQYVYTDIKGLDFDALAAKYRPMVEKAEQDKDVEAFQEAIYAFSLEFHDGHVSSTPPQAILDTIKGRLGMRLAETDEGDVIVISVTEGLPADKAGIKLGAVIDTWDGKPIADAVADEPLILSQSSEHAARDEQFEFLTRGQLGDSVEVTFRNPDGSDQQAKLTFSEDIDGRDVAANTMISAQGEDYSSLPIVAKLLPSGIGYIKINTFFADPILMTTAWDYALNNLMSMGAVGLIVDVRDNGGGYATGSLYFAGSFTDTPYVVNEDMQLNGDGDLVDAGMLQVDPSPVQWPYPVAVLVDDSCASACEIFAGAMSLNSRVSIVGYTPTAGIEAGVAQWALPDDTMFQASVLGSYRSGKLFIEGTGVAPTVVVPASRENLIKAGTSDDVVLDTAQDALWPEIEAMFQQEGTPVASPVASPESLEIPATPIP
ncbi:MAG: S41 family peptidase [Thermomicrobiales bacterium]